MQDPQLKPRQERKPYVAPAVVYQAPLKVRAGTPLGGVIKSIKGLTDPAKLWSK
jgi:hypothetical protein